MLKQRKLSRISHLSLEIAKFWLVLQSYISFFACLSYVKDKIKFLNIHLNIKSSQNTDLFPNNFWAYFIDYVITVVLVFSPLYPPSALYPPPSWISPLSSCLWVVHISSLVSLFPVVFLISPCLCYVYQLCFLFPVPILPHSLPSPPHW